MAFNLEIFFFDTPIYTVEKIGDSEINSSEFDALFYFNDKRDVEGYNPWRKVASTFSITRRLTYSESDFKIKGGYASVIISCKRYHDEFIFYIFWNPSNKTIIKIGQFPTVADFHLGEMKQYNKVISTEMLKELTRAIGLAANGVGIGSYVYLRRIFEYLIGEAYTKAKVDSAILEADFKKARMDEKIDLLHSYLPNFLIESKSMYSILSVGIHELDEQTCLAHFDTLRVGIEIILDEKLEEFRRKEKIETAKQKLAALKGQIRK
ncbi:short-chain dehydrogenase [Chitinophaga barathri]|uniref:Short-chain dehydrogenase n=1 Tax=Chitinophaga barathri TaxID=1647451 RepID=A0A3N4MYV5_9BACT|nr:short-chain dehydrogenase [Chitinophaga barathri]RPD40603.1 short-chain dehydrogenase [Chitinophaga barathri]